MIEYDVNEHIRETLSAALPDVDPTLILLALAEAGFGIVAPNLHEQRRWVKAHE